jgi:ABC-type cobalt transport system substrate-binding protein
MPDERTSKWIALVFVLLIIVAIILIYIGRTSLEWQNAQEVVATLIIIMVLFVVVYFVSRRLLGSSLSSSDDSLARNIEENSYEYSSGAEFLEQPNSTPKFEYDFDTILGSIEQGFNPGIAKNEEDAENQLIGFLNTRFPNKSLTGGHTSTGKKVDIVIDGTYCIELAVVNNEGRLVSLMDQILKYKRDFGEVGVILLDLNEVPAYTIEKYIDAYKKVGAKVIIKKCHIDNDSQEK